MSTSYTFLFPGQGSQYVGMLGDLYEGSAPAREIVDRADDQLGYRLSSVCFEGPPDALQQTEHTQPAIFLHSYVLFTLLAAKGVAPHAAAGHSLGEYTAFVAAGAITFEDGLRLVRLRGRLMQQAGEDQPGTMAAVVGLDPDTVRQICNTARQAGIVQPANFNAPGQIVISGSVEGVMEAMEEAKARGAKLVKELVVSGAFHSPLMQSAQAELGEALYATEIRTAAIPVYSNVTGKPATDPADIRKVLHDQIISPVLWEACMKNMIADRRNNFLEVGPGRVLQGLCKRIDPATQHGGVDKWNDLDRINS
jgi:[acyl-carrier-protein] S-malonyltransferase